MKRVLICCGIASAQEKLSAFLAAHGYDVCAAEDALAAGEQCRRADAVVLVPSPKSDWQSAVRFALGNNAALLVLAEPSVREGATQLLYGTGAAVLDARVGAPLFLQSLRIVSEMGERLRRLRDENERLKTALGDLKLVDRAKCALVRYLGMSESDAHRFIEKQAMDGRRSRRDVALDILKTYES